ncbi:hypothetical protein [Knoellia subterranea]|uniref:Uncharacterized protein n=1 Tax=Knoellia subterranea KCTC 19937 TaxID=1385521 RepID=A0A0A0JI14_9MICO|nr:hypothetical protein [Knoellia subterranea]KGN35316.1 hypothetical protein N803_09185 [Knoellia subterranea KCTC 19937]
MNDNERPVGVPNETTTETTAVVVDKATTLPRLGAVIGAVLPKTQSRLGGVWIDAAVTSFAVFMCPDAP